MPGPVPDLGAVAAALRVEPGAAADLSRRPTRDERLFQSKDDARACLAEDARAIDALQERLYAERTRALLVVFQGMDTAGKSGAIKAAFGATGPVGVHVTAFGRPSEAELARDFLWRVHAAVPPKGFIGVFDRSHYEDVLVVRVKGLAPPDVVERRYAQIVAFERHLGETGTAVLKIFLHISKDTQAERLRERLANPLKRWKFNPGDLDDRALWPAFQEAYEIALGRTSILEAPWFVVPAGSTSHRNALVARLVRGALEALDPQIPEPRHDLTGVEFT